MIKHTLLSALILLAAPVFAQDSAPLPDAGLLNQNPSTLEAKQGLKKPASKIASPAASASSPASEAPASEAISIPRKNAAADSDVVSAKPNVNIAGDRVAGGKKPMGLGEIIGGASIEQLKVALEATYNNNPRIKSERQAVQALDERMSQALSEWRPNVSADYSNGRQRTSFDDSDWNYSDSETKQLSVTQQLFNGGQTWARTKSAKNAIKSGRFSLQNTEQEVMLGAITAYMDVVQSQSVAKLSGNQADVLGEQLNASQDRFDVGEVTRTDVAQSQARLSRAKSDLIQAEGNLAAARASFERVVGFKPGILPVPDQFPAIPATLDETIQLALANNPELNASRFLEKSTDYDTDARIGAILPQVSLRGTMSRQDGAGVLGTNKFDNDAVTVNVQVPIYQQGAEYSRIRETKKRHQQRKFEMFDATNGTVEAATRAWERLLTARSSIESNEDAIRAAEIALDGVKQEQQYGSRTTLDVLDAEQELFAAQVNLIRSQRDAIVAHYNLLSVVGALSPKVLGLNVEEYDPKANYDSVKWQFIGF